MHITNIHGRRLSFVQIEITDLAAIFNIWTLDMKYSATGQQQPNWIITHKITIAVGQFSFERNPPEIFKVLGIRNEEMLFHNTETGTLFAYNFELRTLRLIWKFYPKRFQLIYEFSPYVPTLVLE